MGKSTKHSYWQIAQRGTRLQKYFPIVVRIQMSYATMAYNEEEIVPFSIDDRLRITINTIINAIRHTSNLNVECRMSAVCNNVIAWRSSAKPAKNLLWSEEKSFNNFQNCDLEL